MSEGSPRIGTQGRARPNLRRLPRPEVRSYYASPSASAVIGWRVAGTIPAAHLLSISVWHGIVSDHQDVQDATLMAASFRSPNTWRRLFLAKYAHRIGVRGAIGG